MAASTALNGTTRLQPGIQLGQTRHFLVGVRTRTEYISNFWIVSVFGLLVCTFLVYFHTVLIESQANHKQQEIIRIQEQNDMMQARLAELKTLSTVEARATELGMQPVEQYRYIALDPTLSQRAALPLVVDNTPSRYPVQPPAGF